MCRHSLPFSHVLRNCFPVGAAQPNLGFFSMAFSADAFSSQCSLAVNSRAGQVGSFSQGKGKDAFVRLKVRRTWICAARLVKLMCLFHILPLSCSALHQRPGTYIKVTPASVEMWLTLCGNIINFVKICRDPA